MLEPEQIFFKHLQLSVEILVFIAKVIKGVLQSLVLNAGVSVILKDVFFLHFKGTEGLLTVLLFVWELFSLPLKVVVGLGRLAKLLVDVLILPRESLNVLSELLDFLGPYQSKLTVFL